MSKVIFLQDLFAHQHLGGGELHDAVVINHLKSKDLLYETKNTYDVTPEYILNNTDKYWFISNFVALKNVCKALISKECRYLIYEHDYKFLRNRNPIDYPNFQAPNEAHKYNFTFYQNAEVVMCLSKMHREIFENNLVLDNLDNIHCSMWSDSDLELMSSLNKNQKLNKFAVINSSNLIKKTAETVAYCQDAGIPFDLISAPDHREFLTLLSRYMGLVFRTGHPEPTPRVAVEAKMLNCKFLSQKTLIGVAHEDWFHLNGDELIEEVRSMRDLALDKLERIMT